MASLGVEVILSAMSHSAAAMKSSKTFCRLSFRPASYHSRPYSPPPRRLAMAETPPISSQTMRDTENPGVRDTLKPP